MTLAPLYHLLNQLLPVLGSDRMMEKKNPLVLIQFSLIPESALGNKNVLHFGHYSHM